MAEKVTRSPALITWLCGCATMVGGTFTVSVAVALVMVLTTLLTTTV